MQNKYFRSLWIAVLYFSLQVPAALATPEEDMAKADNLFDTEDIKEAAQLLRTLADQNYTPAQVRLGEFMYGSDDYEEAFGWFLTAALQGNAEGQFRLGQMYADGYGIEKNPDKAFYWIKKAGEQNNYHAVKLLALYSGPENPKLKRSFGIIPNPEQAEYWAAKLPALEKIEAQKKKALEARLAAEAEKKAAERAKAKEAKEKLLCGLKC